MVADEAVKKIDFAETFKRMHPEVSVLLGHDWREPLGTSYTGNVRIHSVSSGLQFNLHLSPVMMSISYVGDFVAALRAGIALKLSLGVRLDGEIKPLTHAGCVSATSDMIRSLTLVEISIVASVW